MTKNETKIQINTEMLITEWETKFDIFLLKKFNKVTEKSINIQIWVVLEDYSYRS